MGKRHNRVYPGQKATQQAGYLLIYSVKRTQLIGRRPLSPCRVRKTAGYTLPRLLFSRTIPRFSEMYPDLAGSRTLPSAFFFARITSRSQQRTPKPKSSCLATGIASLGGRSAPNKEHQNINSSISKHTMAYHQNSFQSNSDLINEFCIWSTALLLLLAADRSTAKNVRE